MTDYASENKLFAFYPATYQFEKNGQMLPGKFMWQVHPLAIATPASGQKLDISLLPSLYLKSNDILHGCQELKQ